MTESRYDVKIGVLIERKIQINYEVVDFFENQIESLSLIRCCSPTST